MHHHSNQYIFAQGIFQLVHLYMMVCMYFKRLVVFSSNCSYFRHLIDSYLYTLFPRQPLIGEHKKEPGVSRCAMSTTTGCI